jgi:hypothetical protein
VIAAAILERLLRHSHVRSIRGQPYRLRNKLNVTLQHRPRLPRSRGRDKGGHN